MTFGQGRDRGHFAGHAGIVDCEDRLRPIADRALDLGFIDVQRVVADVHEDWHASPENEGVGRRHERERRHDDLIARSDIRQEGGHFQRRRARVGQQRLAHRRSLFEPVVTPLREGTVTG